MAITKLDTYQPLTEQSAIAMAVHLGIFEDGSLLTCEEIGDGNLNLVFHVVERDTGKGIIIKQALPYAKVVGESWPLTIERARIEAGALHLQRSFVGDLVPEVYHSDPSLAVTVMEDLSNLTIARAGLINGNKYPRLSDDIGTFLANTLYFTSDYALHPFKKKEYVKEFSNPELCKITEDLVFTDPFFNSETNEFEEELSGDVQQLWEDFNVKLEVAKLKKSFLTEGEALLHGDLHTGSIFVDEKHTKVIDPEFAFYGPIGFDIGQFIANLIFQVISKPHDKESILHHIENTWIVFSTTFSRHWKESGDAYTKVNGYLEYVLEKSFQDSIGFAGCECIRRTIGLAHVDDLESIEDKDQRLKAKRACLNLGKKLIVNRKHIHSIEELLNLVRSYSE
ncbi:S-methyl-5-thioribose kinase [Rossellomorea vietnamensis]|uniref:Methylthioribose kinase n=1 Tax=Rossellomorea vietnamensis TaxID=218284 RepID=A0A0N8GHH8_9BACI|nr:S-methyl-5-thioribose kinase [Rossellomorea vietnamensis]KPL61338.1 methylthioribose kinase [Rossellomorea vietnamensis]